MALSQMNITLVKWENGYKYSFLLREDYQLADFIAAAVSAGIEVKDYVLTACNKKLNLDDAVEFNSQKRLLASTFIILSPKTTSNNDNMQATRRY